MRLQPRAVKKPQLVDNELVGRLGALASDARSFSSEVRQSCYRQGRPRGRWFAINSGHVPSSMPSSITPR